MTRPKRHIHIPARASDEVEPHKPDGFIGGALIVTAIVVIIFALMLGTPL